MGCICSQTPEPKLHEYDLGQEHKRNLSEETRELTERYWTEIVETCGSKRPGPVDSQEPLGMDAEENQAKAIRDLFHFEDALTQ